MKESKQPKQSKISRQIRQRHPLTLPQVTLPVCIGSGFVLGTMCGYFFAHETAFGLCVGTVAGAGLGLAVQLAGDFRRKRAAQPAMSNAEPEEENQDNSEEEPPIRD